MKNEKEIKCEVTERKKLSLNGKRKDFERKTKNEMKVRN